MASCPAPAGSLPISFFSVTVIHMGINSFNLTIEAVGIENVHNTDEQDQKSRARRGAQETKEDTYSPRTKHHHAISGRGRHLSSQDVHKFQCAE